MTNRSDDIARRRQQLTDRLAQLEARLHEISTELESHQNRDWDDLAVEREDDEVLEGIGTSGQAEIRQIKAALARMDAGEYGACVTCGEVISEDRLDLLPFTPFCRRCPA